MEYKPLAIETAMCSGSCK